MFSNFFSCLLKTEVKFKETVCGFEQDRSLFRPFHPKEVNSCLNKILKNGFNYFNLIKHSKNYFDELIRFNGHKDKIFKKYSLVDVLIIIHYDYLKFCKTKPNLNQIGYALLSITKLITNIFRIEKSKSCYSGLNFEMTLTFAIYFIFV